MNLPRGWGIGLLSKVWLLVVMAGLVLLSGCAAAGASGPSVTTGASTPSSVPPVTGSGVAQPVLASSELVVGKNRFVLGMLDSKNGKPIPDIPEVSLQFFKVHADGTATKVGDASTVY